LIKTDTLSITLAPTGRQDGQSGVRISHLRKGGKAASKGLRVGDVIDHINGESVDTVIDAYEMVRQARADRQDVLVLRIAREDQRRFVALILNSK